jgi:putative MFS transporter
MIAGTSNLLKPAATEAAVFPAFMFLACCGLAIGLAFTFSVVRHMAKRHRRTPRLASAPAAVPVATTPGSSLGPSR